MSISEILNFGYYGLIAVAIIVWVGFKLYSFNHTIKNKWLAQIPDLAAAFVHQAETTNNDGPAKMDNVVTSVCDILRKNNINITSELENAIKAYAEKELATTINADKTKADKEVANNETK